MDFRNRIGLYGAYLCATAGIGFTLPFLPLYLSEVGHSDRAIGWISTFAALAGLAQFPIGLWSDRLGARKPFLLAALALLTLSTVLLRGAQGLIGCGFVVLLFAENGICRATIESLSGAEVAALASPGKVGTALGVLRMWKPIGIIGVALVGTWWTRNESVGSILWPLTFVHGLGFLAALLIHESVDGKRDGASGRVVTERRTPVIPRDPALWSFVAAMILFHAANAPGGVYLGLFLNRDLHASNSFLAYAFVSSMLAWMVAVWPAGHIADRWGRRPLLILTWAAMGTRLALIAVARTPAQVVAIQGLDGFANGLFAVLAATWVTDRLADKRRVGEAQVLVGTSLVLGSAIGPAIAAMFVDQIGYRMLFGGLAATAACATGIVILAVPETLRRRTPPVKLWARPQSNECETPTTAARPASDLTS
jgi:MFS family permease